MTGRSLSNLLSNEEQSLEEVWGWYEFQRALIGEEQSRVADLLANGVSLTMTPYLDKTRDELDGLFAFQAAELDRVTILGMLACTEAALRVDFIERVSNRKKDPVSRRFRDVHRRRGERIRLDEDILDTWRDFGVLVGIKRAVEEFKGALNLRHWLAHGRFWKPKLGRASGYDAVDAFEICKQLLQVIDLMPPDSPS